MGIVSYIVDPPVVVFLIFLFLMLIVIKKYLRKDHFYTLVISTFLSFLLAEAACRFMNIGNPAAVVVWTEDRVKKDDMYTYKPNTKLIYRYPDNHRGYFNNKNEVLGNINSKGFRGPDKTFEKPYGIIRVAFLGDSFTLGIGVKDEDTLPARFEHKMRSGRNNIEVLNFGVSGTSTKQQIELLERYAIKFEPDVVVIVIFLNDANRIGTIRFFSRPQVLAEIRKYSFFINAFFGSFEKYILHAMMVSHYQDGFVEGSKGWESIKAALRKGKSLSENHDFQFVVAVYPVLIQLNDEYPFKNIHKTIENYCVSLEVPFVDLLDGFVGQNDFELWVHPTDQHPNEIAHGLAAAELSKFFDDENSIKEP